jgi:uncharacterized SAM-dependent methyltransferase
MTQNFNSNSQIPTLISRIAEPSSEFYLVFSQEEVLEIIHALEVRREIPLKYSYKGRGAKIWDDFYIKYIIPTWYRTSNVEITLLKDNFQYINDITRNYEKLNIIDVGAGNSYPVKEFIRKFSKLGRLNKYIALDISEELLNRSQTNIKKWFPSLKFTSDTIDIENHCIPKSFLEDEDNIQRSNTANIILHLGVTIGNHYNRQGAFKNFRDSMNKNDLLVFTNEIGTNSQWDGKVRGGCNYHAQQIFEWIKSNIGISSEDCELIRKYDSETDSVVANIKFCHNYTLNFNVVGIDKSLKISEGEEITIWRHHKFEIPQLLQELEQAGLQLVHYSNNKYLSHIMVICSIVNN